MTATDEFDTKAEGQIATCLWPARDKWIQIGRVLNIDGTTLEVIRLDNPYRTDDCIFCVIAEWLQNGKPAPCWMVLAKALTSPLVGVTVVEGKR